MIFRGILGALIGGGAGLALNILLKKVSSSGGT
jgi:hypothetical protein